MAGGEEWWKRAHRYARDVCIWRGGEWWCGWWGRAHRFTGGALCLAGWRGRRARRLSGGVCALIVGWRCFGFWAGGEGEVVARIDIRVAFVCVNRGGWWGGSGGGARSSIVGWRVCVWRVGRVVGGARSSLFKWRVGVWRAGRDGGGARFGWRFVLMGGEWWESALNDMLVARWAGGGRGGESAYRYDGCACVCLAGAEGGKGMGEGRAH